MKNARPQTTEASALDKCHSNATGDFFPELLPPVTPAIKPTSGSRADEALQALIAGPQNQADYRSGWRLSAYVKALQYLGWAFIKRDITRPNCRRPITEYRIDHSDPRTAAALDLRQGGSIDPQLIGLLAMLGACAAMLAGVA